MLYYFSQKIVMTLLYIKIITSLFQPLTQSLVELLRPELYAHY